MYTGPNTVNDGLVFGYDTGYGVADNNTATRLGPVYILFFYFVSPLLC